MTSTYYQKHKDEIRKKRNKAYAENPEQRRNYNKNWWKQKRRKDPQYSLWKSAKDRAARKNVPFSITKEDIYIPLVCPVLGIPLLWGDARAHTVKPNSPSLDRMVPALGYVPGNIAVISLRADYLKKDGTPDELRRVAQYAASSVKKAA